MKKLWVFLQKVWLPAGLTVGGLGLSTAVLFFRLDSLLPGLSSSENSYIRQSSTLHNLVLNPLFLPHKLFVLLLQLTHHATALSVRGVSALYGLVAVVLFFWLMKQLFTKRVALLGTSILLVSSWFLHTSRVATPYISYITLVLALLTLSFWLRHTKHLRWACLLLGFVGILTLYLPGILPLMVLLVAWQRKLILAVIKKLPWWFVALGALLLTSLLAPLVWACVHDMSLIHQVLGVPDTWQPITWLKNIIAVPEAIFIRSAYTPELWLGRLPLLDICGMVFALLGMYKLAIQHSLVRTPLFILMASITTLLIGLGSLPLSTLIPVIYAAITIGLALLLQQWFQVFPRNPIARAIGITLLILTIGTSSFYQLKSYYAAWPHAPDTKSSYTEKISI